MKKKQTSKKDSLVGKFFHTFVDGKLSWQGVITTEPTPGYFLVQLYEWLCGHPGDKELVPIAQMVGWRFYDDIEDWRDAATIIGQLETRKEDLSYESQRKALGVPDDYRPQTGPTLGNGVIGGAQ